MVLILAVLVALKIVVYILSKAYQIYLRRSKDTQTQESKIASEIDKNMKNGKSRILKYCGNSITFIDNKMDYELYWGIYTAM